MTGTCTTVNPPGLPRSRTAVVQQTDVVSIHEPRATDHPVEETVYTAYMIGMTNTNMNTNANGHMNFQPRQSA